MLGIFHQPLRMSDEISEVADVQEQEGDQRRFQGPVTLGGVVPA